METIRNEPRQAPLRQLSYVVRQHCTYILPFIFIAALCVDMTRNEVLFALWGVMQSVDKESVQHLVSFVHFLHQALSPNSFTNATR